MFLLDILPSRGALQLVVFSLLLLIGINTSFKYRRTLNLLHNHPGFRLLFYHLGFAGNVLPRIPHVSIGANWGMVRKYKPYADAGWDVLSCIWMVPKIRAGYVVADPVTIKEVTLHRARFPKPVEDYTILSFFGKNIVVTEGEDWKKHRKIIAPSFSEKNNKLVWDETVRFTLEMFESWGIDESEVVMDHAVDFTLPLALLVIGAAGFGQHLSWGKNTLVPPGHQRSFTDTLHTLSLQLFVKLLAPNWAYRFSKFLRNIQECVDEIQVYMQEMITERRASEVKEERNDLFSALLDANDLDETEDRLSDQELISNIFMFLVAGHETTAHTLCFALGLLAIEQEEQEKLYQHITSLLPEDQNPTYEYMNTLAYTIAVLYETLRIFPPVQHIPKFSAEDTTLPVVRPDGSLGSIPVPKGTLITLSPAGLHYNPRYWPDPTAFRPSRFLGDWSKDAFLPFSAGPRACVGRRFSETESVAIITLIVRRYRIDLKNPEQFRGLTQLQKREKLLTTRPGITTTPTNVPLVFKRR